VSFPGKKAPWPFLFFSILFFSLNKQKTEHQSESNSVTFWTSNLWKTSLYHVMLREAACHFSPPAGYKAACVNLQTEQLTVPTVHTSSPLQSVTQHPPLQQQKYTQIHTRATKPIIAHNFSPHNSPLSHPPFSVIFTSYWGFCIYPNNHYPPNFHCL
jgi:hypothetical protein